MNEIQIFVWIFIAVFLAGGAYLVATNKKDKSLTGGCGNIKSIYVYMTLLIGILLLSILNLV